MNSEEPQPSFVRLEILLQAVIDKTLAALSGSEEQKAAWRRTLGELEDVLEDQGQREMAIFLDLVSALLDGEDPERLEVLVAPELMQAWGTIKTFRG